MSCNDDYGHDSTDSEVIRLVLCNCGKTRREGQDCAGCGRCVRRDALIGELNLERLLVLSLTGATTDAKTLSRIATLDKRIARLRNYEPSSFIDEATGRPLRRVRPRNDGTAVSR